MENKTNNAVIGNAVQLNLIIGSDEIEKAADKAEQLAAFLREIEKHEKLRGVRTFDLTIRM
jgi:hypothetical protein